MIRVTCYGDSNTYGYDPRSYWGSRYPADYRWVDLLAAKTGWEIQNDGINSREIPLLDISVPSGTEMLIVMLGTNDLLQGAAVETVAKRMESFLIRLDLKKDKLLLIAPPHMQSGAWVPDRSLIDKSMLLAHSYRDLSERLRIRFVDAGKWNIALTFDGVHFTEEGHKAFAENLYQYLSEGE